ncbi:MAG: XVIPCD domain-containing protein [Arenimonas sp.]
MTVPTKDYAFLSKHVYGDMDAKPLIAGTEIHYDENGALKYKVLEVVDELSGLGYQGAIYKNMTTGELIVAHRGTVIDIKNHALDTGLDLAITDGAMVLEAVNTQAPAATHLVERAKELSQMPENRVRDGKPDPDGYPAPITVTGHSLGGTLAEITAQRYGLSGESFNAYGAVGIMGVQEGRSGHGMINHMRATDFVSAGNGHYGEVRVYANAADIAALNNAGVASTRQGTSGFLYDLGANVNSHKMGESFWPLDKSVISEDNRQRYRDNAPLVDAFRDDVRTSREVITFGSQFNQVVHGDMGAIRHLTGTPLPTIPDHLQRSAINNAIEPIEGRLRSNASAIKVGTEVLAPVAEQSTVLAGRVLGKGVELQGRVPSQALDIAGDAVEASLQLRGKVQQQVTVQTGRVVSTGMEVLGETAANGRGLLGQVEALKERGKGEAQGAMLSFTAKFYHAGGLFSDNLKQQARALDDAAAKMQQQGVDRSRNALERASIDSHTIAQSSQALAGDIKRNAAELGQSQAQQQALQGASVNRVLDETATGIRTQFDHSAANVRQTTAQWGTGQRFAIDGVGDTASRHLNNTANSMQQGRNHVLDAVTNPRPAEGVSAGLHGPSLADAKHPQYSLYVQAHTKLEALGSTGLRSHQELDNVAAALAAQAAKQHLTKVDQVVASPDGKRFFAVEGKLTDPAHQRVHVETDQARQQTLEQSTQQVNQVQKQNEHTQLQTSTAMRM